MCPLHKGGRVHGCPACYGGLTDFVEITSHEDAKAKYLKDRERYTAKPMSKPMRVIEAPAPTPPPSPPVDPMIVLADLADKIDEKRRMFRVSMLMTTLSALLLLVGAAALTVGLFLVPELIWMATPVTILGLYCVLNWRPVDAFFAIHEARAEFARAQRRVGQ